MIKKIRKFFPEISLLKFSTLILISLFYGLTTIVTIYIVSTLASLLNGSSNINLITPILISVDFLTSIFGITDKMAHISIGLVALTFMVIFGLLKVFFISKICSTARHNLSMQILKKTLSTNYDFLDKTHSGNSKSLILDETAHVIQQLLRPTIEIITSIVFVSILLINLYFYDSKLTIVSSILFGVMYLIIFIFTRSLITQHGQSRFLSNKKRFKKVDDALSLKLLSNVLKTINLFLDRYSEDSKKMAKHQYLFDFISASPKIIIEAIIFLIVLIMIYIGLNNGSAKFDEISLTQTIIFFALTGLKMLPEFQRIFVSLGLLKFGNKSQEGVYNLLNNNNESIFESKIDKKKYEKLILSFDCESCTVGDQKILNKINLMVNIGDRLAIKGRSGAGKTTLMHALMGVIPINFNQKKGFFRANIKFGYLPQETNLFSSTVLENIVMGRKIDKTKKDYIKKITASLFPEFQNVNIDIFLNRIIDDVVTELSVGQKQRIGLLRAIYDHPDMLILDEFTSALDKKNEQIIIDFIDQFKLCKTLIIVGHREESIKICNKFLKIEDGNLIKE